MEKDLRESGDGVATTLEEPEAFQIVRASICNVGGTRYGAVREFFAVCGAPDDEQGSAPGPG